MQIAILLLIVVGVKVVTHNYNPVSSFGDYEDVAVEIPLPNMEIEGAGLMPTPAPAPTPAPIAESQPSETYERVEEFAPELSSLIDEALAGLDTRPPRIIEARDRLNAMLSEPMSAQQSVFVRKLLSKLSQEWLFGRTVFVDDKLCSNYRVQQGDQFRMIEKEYKTPYEILMQINGIGNPKALRAGETIKAINGPFHCIVYRSAFRMDLYLQDMFVRSFPVGLGRAGMETPTGRWAVKVGDKLISPTWTDPETGKTYESENPNYPLGLRWIGLRGIEGAAKDRTGFAIHGTKDPQQVGVAGSRGCIRLLNEDVMLVYNLLMPGLSHVTVVD